MDTLLDLMTALERARLTAKQRAAIDAVYMRDMTQKDAAQVAGVSSRAFEMMLARAVRKLENAKGANQ
jgi:DNA-directed RNA polymerase specialized sigma24 family protein